MKVSVQMVSFRRGALSTFTQRNILSCKSDQVQNSAYTNQLIGGWLFVWKAVMLGDRIQVRIGNYVDAVVDESAA